MYSEVLKFFWAYVINLACPDVITWTHGPSGYPVSLPLVRVGLIVPESCVDVGLSVIHPTSQASLSSLA